MTTEEEVPRKKWLIERPHDHYEAVAADNIRVEAGCLVLTNGDIFNSEFVASWGVGFWVSACPLVEECSCDNDEDDE